MKKPIAHPNSRTTTAGFVFQEGEEHFCKPAVPAPAPSPPASSDGDTGLIEARKKFPAIP
jgi:hypothetical protein